MLITEQGKVLDNIDNNVEAAKNNAHEGVEHIEQVEEERRCPLTIIYLKS